LLKYFAEYIVLATHKFNFYVCNNVSVGCSGGGIFFISINKKKLFNPQNRLEMGEFFQETIDNHRATFDPSNIRDLVDMYLAEIQRAKEEGTGEALFEGKDHGKARLHLNTGLI
jgi:hypothetical protein